MCSLLLIFISCSEVLEVLYNIRSSLSTLQYTEFSVGSTGTGDADVPASAATAQGPIS